MKLFQKIIPTLVIVALVFLSQTVFAQRHHHPERMLEKMTTELNLSDAQVQQIKSIFENAKPQMEALRDQDEEDTEATRAKIKALKEQHKAAIEKLLTPEQLSKFQSMRKHKKGKRGKHGRKARLSKEDHQALRAEMENYKKENILPVLKEQRLKLDQVISQEDQRIIEDLRPKLKAEKAKRDAEHQKRAEDFMRGEKLSKEERKQRKAERKKKGESENKMMAKKLADKYESAIDELLAAIEPQQKQWDADIKDIQKKYKERARAKHKEAREKGTKTEEGRQARKRQKHGRKHHGKKKHMMRKEMKKVRFLMLDTKEDNPATTNINSTPMISKMLIFPNPSVSENTLQFDVAEAGNISIELRDKAGTLVRTIEQAHKETGTYRINISLLNLKNGIYYYTIKDKNGKVNTQEFVLMQ